MLLYFKNLSIKSRYLIKQIRFLTKKRNTISAELGKSVNFLINNQKNLIVKFLIKNLENLIEKDNKQLIVENLKNN